jgi:hypothetical protein
MCKGKYPYGWCSAEKPITPDLLEKKFWANEPKDPETERCVGYTEYAESNNIVKGFVQKNCAEKGNYMCEVSC